MYTQQDIHNNPILLLQDAFNQLDDWYLDLQDTAIAASPVTVKPIDWELSLEVK